MRLLAGLVASSLVTLVTSTTHVAQLSPDETRLLLAERLGVSRFHELKLQGQDIRQTTLDISAAFEKKHEPVDTMFAETPRKGNFVLSLAGMKDNRLDPDLPAMVIIDDSTKLHDEAPTSSSVANLLARLAAEKAELSGLHQHAFSSTPAGGICVSVPKLEQLAKFESPLDDAGLPSRLPTDLLHLASALDPTNPSHSAFLTEFTMIRKFMEVVLPGLPENGMSYCHAPAVAALIAAHGPTSAESIAASALYSYLLHHLPSSISSTVLLLPQPHTHAKRAEAPLSMIQPEPSSPPTDTASKIFNPARIALCHDTKTACETNTGNCTSHGKCHKAIKAGANACWTCSCTPSVITSAAGNKTTTWAGAACQKKDVSVPFNIFLVFGIVIMLVAIATVNLLYSIGEEELPSVLSAGVAPPAKRT